MSLFDPIAGTPLKNVSSGSTHSGLTGEVLDMVGGARGGGPDSDVLQEGLSLLRSRLS
jgi:hypothetical protein